MPKSTAKKMGRPPLGERRLQHVPARFDPEMLKAIDFWAKANDTTRTNAIRRLVELGLKSQSIGRGKWWVNRKPVHD